MVNEEQKKEMLKKLSIILESLKDCKNIKEVSEVTQIPTSTIQRYLSRTDYYEELVQYGFLSRENLDKLRDYTASWLGAAKIEGLQRGGKISQEKHGFNKSEGGKFRGSGR